MAQLNTDTSELQTYLDTLASKAPQVVDEMKRVTLIRIAESDKDRLKSVGFGKLKTKKRLDKAIYFSVAKDNNRLEEYGRWIGFVTAENASTVTPRNSKFLMIWKPGALDKKGKRKYSPAQVKEELTSGKMRIIYRPGKAPLLVRETGKRNKKGNYSKNSKTEIIAILKRSVRHPGGKFSLVANHNANFANHNRILTETANEIVDKSPLVDGKA
jgi:hypothetical protein